MTNTIKKAKTKINILKCLSVMPYKSIGRSVLVYIAPIWTPILADNHGKRLQTVQN